jgi:sulfur carrier protein
MLVTVNGKLRELPDDARIPSLLELLARPADGRGVAVAVDGEVVPRARWDTTQLAEGAQVEVVTAVQGG